MTHEKDTEVTGEMNQSEKGWLWQQVWGPEFESFIPI